MPLKDGCVDLVVTSPPYLNAIDYLRCSKFSLVWMGYSVGELRAIRATSVGSEVSSKRDTAPNGIMSALNLRPALPPRLEAVLRRYVTDIDCVIHEIARVLAPDGRAVIVIGENTIRGTFIPTATIVRKLAAAIGLQMVQHSVRDLPSNRRYLPPPGRRGGARTQGIRRESVMTFEA